jgi:hypothetical protein
MRLAYLLSQYPTVTHTFLLREIRVLRESGLDIPAQASHALRHAELLAHHTWALSRGSTLTGFPARALASYKVQPTTVG